MANRRLGRQGEENPQEEVDQKEEVGDLVPDDPVASQVAEETERDHQGHDEVEKNREETVQKASLQFELKIALEGENEEVQPQDQGEEGKVEDDRGNPFRSVEETEADQESEEEGERQGKGGSPEEGPPKGLMADFYHCFLLS